MSIERIRRKIPLPEDFPQKSQASIPPQKFTNRPIEEYKQFVGLHKDESFVICAWGSSLNDYDNFDNHITSAFFIHL